MDQKRHAHSATSNSLTIAALGVVFGDIGTSPLYSIREAFHGHHAMALTPDNVMGVMSLILWSIFLVISLKYLGFIMRADNKGEGGVLALTALSFSLRGKLDNWLVRLFVYMGLFGSALLVGDGIITPAISVLSAVEGLEIATPFFTPYVIPITLLILATLFLYQHVGTAKLGKVFGFVVLVWFFVIGALGVRGIISNPTILLAINPLVAIQFFIRNGMHSLVALGAVFLVVTGGEALYADMGHFGKAPIQKAWFFAALPGLALNYLGQGALLLTSPENAINPFYRLAPSWALYPLVILAMMATVIASQAVISGVFSLTRQAIQLGYAPRVGIVHTSRDEIGQIYVPKVNWALFIMTCWLVLEFRTSSALAAAYGIAVSATMVITTLLACSVAYRKWKWSVYRVAVVLVFFFTLDFIFLCANFSKIADGGWFPLVIGLIIFTLMVTWSDGREILLQRLKEKSIPFSKFLEQLKKDPLASVSGTAFFLTGDPNGVPLALMHNVKHNKVLHNVNVLLTITSEDVPTVSKNDRINLEQINEQFYRVTAHYGFMQTPSMKDILKGCALKNLNIKLREITFFLGRETMIATQRPGMAIWREKLFTVMSRNAERATAYFDIPSDQVVEVGIQIEL